MHSNTQDLLRDLSDLFDVRVDEHTGRVTISHERHVLATYEPGRQHVIIQIWLSVESTKKGSKVSVDLNDLAPALQSLSDEGLRVTNRCVEPLGDSEREAIHLMRLEGEGLATGFLQAVIVAAWGWSLPAIERNWAATT